MRSGLLRSYPRFADFQQLQAWQGTLPAALNLSLLLQVKHEHWAALASEDPADVRQKRRDASITAAHERLEALRAARKDRVQAQKKCVPLVCPERASRRLLYSHLASGRIHTAAGGSHARTAMHD